MNNSITASLHPSGVQTVTYARAVELGYDLVQAKARGQPCRIQVSRGCVRVYGWADEPLQDYTIDNTLSAGTFLGIRVNPTLLIIHDCVEIAQEQADHPRLSYTDLASYGYRDRFAFVKQQLTMIDLPCLRAVQNYRIDTAQALWDRLDMTISNGVVYRKSTAPLREPILVARKYPEVNGGLP